jgi:hypothetical protein
LTAAPRRQRQRGGRRGFDDGKPSLIEWLIQVSTICGVCYGHREVWCPDCAGFDGCPTCAFRLKVPCSECAHGKLDGFQW